MLFGKFLLLFQRLEHRPYLRMTPIQPLQFHVLWLGLLNVNGEFSVFIFFLLFQDFEQFAVEITAKRVADCINV